MGQRSGYSGAPGVGDTTSAPSQNLWAQVDAGLEKPGIWNHMWEDFDNLPFTTLPTTEAAWPPVYKMFSSSGATFAAADIEGGARAMVEATDNEGISWGMASFPYKIIQGAGELVFEARIKRLNITGTYGFFVGLIESVAFTNTVPIVAAPSAAIPLSDNNLVGFNNLESTPSVIDTVYKANTVTLVTVQTGGITLVADTFVKLGMTFNRGGDNILRFYKDGIELGSTKAIPSAAGTDFPNDVRLGAVLATLNGATAALSVTPDWVRVAQKRVTAST
jgi:hypothetical protein